MLFSIMAAPLCIPTQSLGGSYFPYILCSTYSLEIFLTNGRGFLSVDLISYDLIMNESSLVWFSSKESACNAGDGRNADSISELGRSPGEGNGTTLQYSFLENSMDRGTWQATVHGVAKSLPRLRD